MITLMRTFHSLDDLEYTNNVHYLKVEKEEISELMLYLKEHLEMSTLVDIFVSDYLGKSTKKRFVINYLLKNLEFNKYICVQYEFDDDEVIESIAFIWPNAQAWELEIYKLNGISFNYKFPDHFISYPNLLKKDYNAKIIKNNNLEKKEFTLNLAPSHYLQKSDIEICINLKNDIIQECHFNTGFQFRGIEKKSEGLTSEQLMIFSDRWNSNKSLFYNVLVSDTFEKILSIQATDRAMAIRMILLELNRIMEHCYTIAMISYELKFQKLYQDMMLYVQKIKGLVKFYCGDETSTSFSCIGGVRFDLPQGWPSTCINLLDIIEQNLGEFRDVINSSSIWNENLNVGKISSSNALEYGLSGPSLRASGINYDMRKKNPIYFYSEVDFDTPVGQYGNVLDRYLVRVEEIFQSIKIIMQVLDNLPSGEVISKDSLSFRSFRDGNSFNELSYREVLSNKILIPETQIYNSIESSDGEIGIHLVGQGSPYPLRFKIYNSTFNALSLYQNILLGQNYQDALLIYASLNINTKEVER